MARVRAAAVYARISSDQDGTGLGVKRQVADCRALAEQRGWPVAGEYVDNDVSAYSGRRRPQYERLVEDVRDGLVDAVIVYNLDRLTRRPIELEQFSAVCEAAGMTNLATVTQEIDLGNDDGLFMARILAAVAAKESGRKSARVKRKMQENAEAGRPHGGWGRAFGYDTDRITVRPDEAEVIRALVARFLGGESLRSLAAWLDTTGVPTVTGKPWRTTTLKTLLASGRIAGLREHQGQVVGPAMWEAIITEDEHRRVRALMDQRAVSGRRAPRRYLLSGMLRCGKCGRTLYASPRATTRRYVCLSGPDHAGCGRLTVVAEPLEDLVQRAVLLRLDSGEVAASLAGRAADDEVTAALADDLAADQTQLSELAEAYAAKAITMREWMTARKPIEERMQANERRLSAATNTTALRGLAGTGDALRRQWAGLNLDRQHAVVRAVLDHAVIAPGTQGARALDPARVSLVWRT